MKKLIALLLAVSMLAFGLAACSGNNENEENQNGSSNVTEEGENSEEGNEPAEDETAAPAGTAEEIIASIYEQNPVELGSLMTETLDLTAADVVKYNTGLDDASKVKEAAISGPMMGSQAYSLVAVRVNDAADAEEVANAMLNGIDQRKWICVEADNLKVMVKDDVVVLFMVGSELSEVVTVEDIETAFTTLCGGSLDLVLEK